MHARRSMVSIGGLLTGILLTAMPAISQRAAPAGRAGYPVQLTSPVSLPPHGPSLTPRVVPLHHPPSHPSGPSVVDPVLQTTTPTLAAAQAVGQWEGLGEGFPGFSVTAVPPDANVAVGPNHVVQWVNNALVIFDKQGGVVQTAVDDGTFWGIFSTCYQGGGFTDPVVKYDRAADRWVVAEVALPLSPGLFGQYAQCFAVSKTSDPTFVSDANGNNTSYNIWAYGFGNDINDYDKIAVWSDGYYVTWNIFQNGANFIGAEACAWNRLDMLNGVATPGFVCFQLSNAFASLLAADWDGATAPPAGSPDFLMDIDPGSGSLNLWKFHADFTTPGNSTFTGPTSISGVAPFTAPCPDTQANFQDCIPQPGTTQKLDALGDRLMYRLAYRNLGDHESIVANHTVLTAGGNTGIRWYEVRSPGGTPALYQQGTFAPDSDNRWMASAAMDQAGNIGVGYSVSSAVTYPSIRYTGWEVGNPLGTLQAETLLVAGGGSQTAYNRWGDYSAMMIDPSDDCTFWYTQEYQATTQTANWNTRIGSFKFASCGTTVQGATSTTLSSSLNPAVYGQSVTFTATVAPVSGTGAPTGTVTFKDGGTALGSSALNAGGVATFSISSLAAGVHSITAVYGGDANFSGSISPALSESLSKASSKTTLASSPNPSLVSQTVTFTATVTGQYGGTPTGTVALKWGTTLLGTAAVVNGTATITYAFTTSGGRWLVASYSGDGNNLSSSSTAFSQVTYKVGTTTAITSSLNPSNLGQSVTFTATVSSTNTTLSLPLPTGTVSFKDGTTVLGTSPLSGGVATFTTGTLTAGTHSITAVYGSDTNYLSSTSAKLSEVVIGLPTTTTLNASPNPSAYGQPVTFTATVVPNSGTGVPTGTVTFKYGSSTLAKVSLSSGMATYTTATLTAGTKSITAVYSGDLTYAASTSAALSQVINKATTTTALTSSLNPSTSGQAVTFTATVSPQYSGTPTGSVTFRLGTTVLATVTLSGGSASYTSSTLPTGADTISATYSGSGNFTSSSASLAQTVN